MKRWSDTLREHRVVLRQKLGGRCLTADYEMSGLVLFGMTMIHGRFGNQSDRIR